ncbi:MAG: nucleotidyltransferase domain-containing protein [Candidatus Dormibacteria bacterium]
MNPSNPLRTIAPTVDADVLAVLARTAYPLTGRRIHLLTERSYSQVHATLARLCASGLVHGERRGQAVAYTLNRDHVLASSVLDAATSLARVEELVTKLIGSFSIPPVCVALFGSFARRDGDEASDIDVLMVRPAGLRESSRGWAEQRLAFCERVELVTGNRVQLLDVSRAELGGRRHRETPLAASLRREARVLYGIPLDRLLAPSD